MSTLMVIAKAPVAGRVKTRLTPPCSPEQAAALAGAALNDTFAALAATKADRHVVILEGPEPAGLPAGFDVIAQGGGGLGERLAAAFAATEPSGFVVAMDTPQLTPGLLRQALDALGRPDVDAAIGPTPDGGYWGIGLAVSAPTAFDGVPMSAADTYARQRARLDDLGLRTAVLPELRDVDDMADARAVAGAAPESQFAAALRASGHAGDQHQSVPESTA